jgi:hypothetical protein
MPAISASTSLLHSNGSTADSFDTLFLTPAVNDVPSMPSLRSWGMKCVPSLIPAFVV